MLVTTWISISDLGKYKSFRDRSVYQRRRTNLLLLDSRHKSRFIFFDVIVIKRRFSNNRNQGWHIIIILSFKMNDDFFCWNNLLVSVSLTFEISFDKYDDETQEILSLNDLRMIYTISLMKHNHCSFISFLCLWFTFYIINIHRSEAMHLNKKSIL